jgi:hypothetical protein
LAGGVPGLGVEEGSQKSQISLPSRPECTKTGPKRLVSSPFALKITKNAGFYLKVLNKIYSQDVFKGIH